MSTGSDPHEAPTPAAASAAVVALLARMDALERRLRLLESRSERVSAPVPEPSGAGEPDRHLMSAMPEAASPNHPPARRVIEPIHVVRPKAPPGVPRPGPSSTGAPPATATTAATDLAPAVARPDARETTMIRAATEAPVAVGPRPASLASSDPFEPIATPVEPLATGAWPRPSPEPTFRLPSLSEIGTGRLLAWAGGVALVLGAVFFLSLAFSRGWIGNEARVGLGLIGGVVLLGLGPVTFDRRQPTLAHVLVAAGIAILELALYAARLYELVGPGLALAGTFVVAAAATAIAIRFDSQVVAALGLLAVLAAPPIMRAPADLVTVGFLFIVMAATTAVSVGRGWRWLPWLSLGVTYPQLWAWLGEEAGPTALLHVALLGYWAFIVLSAAGELWLRPARRLRDGAATWLVIVLVPLMVVAGLRGLDWWDDRMGAWWLELAAGHAALGAWFLARRSRDDPAGQLFLAIAAPLAAAGILVEAPSELVPIGWALMAAGLAWLSARWGHRAATAEGLGLTGLVAWWVASDIYPMDGLLEGSFPPVGASQYDTTVALAIVGGLLAIVGATVRWVLTTPLSRSVTVSLAPLLVAYVLPFETSGLVLLALWVILSLACLVAATRWTIRELQRGSIPDDPLALTGVGIGIVAVGWSVAGFPMPSGTVDLLSPVMIERAAASLVPIAGTLALVPWLREGWWRGLAAAMALLLATGAIGLQTGAADVAIGATGGWLVEGSLIVLVGWSALALAALVLDERASLRLAADSGILADPGGHPLALAALVPTVGALLWLTMRFLAGGVGTALPGTPFVDERTVATAIVVGFLALGAAAARSRLLRAVLLGVIVVLVAVLLPLEIPLHWAVVGWCGLAVAVLLVTRRSTGPELLGAWALAGALVACAIVATITVLAPPDRLILEMTRVVPSSGPPNEATVALAAIAASLVVGATLAAPSRATGPLWLGVGVTLTWLLSVGIADAFAVRVASGADLAETAKQAQVALSITWAALGLGTLVGGLVWDRPLARQAGLALLTVATVKVFVYDLATLDIAYRVLSLIGLGVLLLVGAYAYLHARQRGGQQPMGR